MIHQSSHKKTKQRNEKWQSFTILNLSAKTTSLSVKAMTSSISDKDAFPDLREGMSLCFFALLPALVPKNEVRLNRERVVVVVFLTT